MMKKEEDCFSMPEHLALSHLRLISECTCNLLCNFRIDQKEGQTGRQTDTKMSR